MRIQALLYTVGLTEKYETRLAAGDAEKKAGGWVFKDASDAYVFLVMQGSSDVRSIYGIEADWEEDTEEAVGQPYRKLLRAAKVVRI